MQKPKFNHVLVQIDDKDSAWGKGNDESLGGSVYSEGTLVEVAKTFFNTEHTPVGDVDFDEIKEELGKLKGTKIKWNEGHEAGTVFEHDGKQYALIYWFDVIGGVK